MSRVQITKLKMNGMDQSVQKNYFVQFVYLVINVVFQIHFLFIKLKNMEQ